MSLILQVIELELWNVEVAVEAINHVQHLCILKQGSRPFHLRTEIATSNFIRGPTANPNLQSL